MKYDSYYSVKINYTDYKKVSLLNEKQPRDWICCAEIAVQGQPVDL
ncbi:hypothetical protein SAMN04487996_12233 [Dyadobacter soli]|uniref:Uncharacterized protein n=1 Tax=Dyadobacter soli TaxID=659014 RepID=A0A1G7WG16_9BACT|nr:hypothetical protein SAMN04487996_12233 [Dyadobacter soli]